MNFLATTNTLAYFAKCESLRSKMFYNFSPWIFTSAFAKTAQGPMLQNFIQP